MNVTEIIVKKITPKLGYIFHSLEDDDVYSDCLYNSTGIVTGSWEEVEDPSAVGTADNPIEYYDGVELINNAYYMIDGVRNVYMDGQFVEF